MGASEEGGGLAWVSLPRQKWDVEVVEDVRSVAHYLVNYFSQVYLLILEEGLVVLVLLLEVGGYGDVFVYLL